MSILDTVNQRTQMVGQNRLELLLFKLKGRQGYGINVFKVKEIVQCPRLTSLPYANPVVCGVAHIRDMTIPVIDLSSAIGGPSLGQVDNCFVIIAEYNRKTQGFLVRTVDRIVNMNWEDIHPPPKGAGDANYLTAVTDINHELIEIIDVEKILSEITPNETIVSEEIVQESIGKASKDKVVLIADDSAVARGQIRRTVEQIGLQAKVFRDGKEAYDYLLEMAAQGTVINDEILMLISDIEMPEMDGYTLTSAIRNHSKLKELWVMLHTSLSGIFNEAMVKKVGANDFIPKFHPDELALAIKKRVELDD